jgi:carbonic anhydrase
MTSCTATAPIDLPTNGNVNPISGTFNCVYDADMCSGASVTISDDRSHLSIKCSGGSKSNISFYGTVYVPTEIRIYAPSLHTYNGSRADAELLVVHAPGSGSNAKSDGLIVSVPVSLAGSANPDLAAIFQAANTINPSTLTLNASAPINYDVNVNNLIPAKPYCVYYGTLPYDSCGGNYYYAAFTDPLSAAGPLSAIVASGIATVQPSMKTNLQKSKVGPVAGVESGSTDEYVLYELVGDDCDDDDAAKPSTPNASASGMQHIGMNVVWGIIIAVALLGIWYMFLSGDDAASTAAAAAAAAAATATAAAAAATATAASAASILVPSAPPENDDD